MGRRLILLPPAAAAKPLATFRTAGFGHAALALTAARSFKAITRSKHGIHVFVQASGSHEQLL
jgi:hypothetical protein